MFAFLGRPLVTLVASILTNRVIGFFDRMERLRTRYTNPTTTGPLPSAPPGPPPPYQEKADNFKYD